MKKLLLFALCLMGVNGIALADDVTGVVPMTSTTYVIYNVGQQLFLTVKSNGEVALSSTGTEFQLATADDGCYYLVSDDRLATEFNQGVGGSTYDQWKLTAVASSTDNTYALGSREDDAYAFSYMYYSNATEGTETAQTQPGSAFGNGLWLFVDPTTLVSNELNLNDENPTLTPARYNAGKITYTRNVSKTYASFCLPFDVDLNSVSSFFTTLYRPLDVAFYNTENEQATILFTPMEMDGTLAANTPFLAKMKTEGEVVFANSSDVTYTGAESNSAATRVQVYDWNGKGAAFPNTDYNISFGGTILPLAGTTADNGIYTMSGVDASFGETSVGVGAFRAYVISTATTASAKPVTIVAGLDEDVETAIASVNAGNTEMVNSIFTLDGRRVSTSLGGKLARGIYIVNGKKVIKK